MAKIPVLSKILQENYMDTPGIQRLAPTLNKFMQETTNAFDKGLTLGYNLACEIKTITAAGVFPLYLSWGRPEKPTIGLIGGISRVDGTDYTLSTAVFLDWEFDNSGRIKIKGLPGLTSSNSDQFYVKVVFFVG